MKAYLSRLDEKASNLGRMMERCGVDPALLAYDQLGQTMQTVARACISCPHGAVCARWLDAAEPGVVNRPPDFCPNAARFRSKRLH